jgi:hypothetical protein
LHTKKSGAAMAICEGGVTQTAETSGIPANPRRRSRWSFATIVWIFVAGCFLVGIGRPLALGLYNASTYQRTPCEVVNGDRYFYFCDGKKYYSERLTTWDEFHLESHLIDFDQTPIKPNDWCYVKPSAPLSAVLHTDAYRQWTGAQTRVIPFAMLVAGAIALTVVSKKKGRSV